MTDPTTETETATDPATDPPNDTTADPADVVTVDPADDTTDPTATDDEQGQDDDTTDDGDGIAKVRREAASYRTKLRETETERDQLADRLASFQRQAVALAATGRGKLADGADIWRTDDTDLADLIAEDGTVDPQAVDDAVAAVLRRHPHWASRPARPRGQPHELRSGAGTERPAASWSDALKRR